MAEGPRWVRVLGLGLLFALLMTACGESEDDSASSAPPVFGQSEPVSVIVDYSPTVSDVGALLYLLSHPSVEVIAVTLPVTGEAGCELGLEVTLGILAMFDQEEIPVACDAEVPPDARPWPSEFLTGHENLTNGLPTSTASPSSESVPDLIARVTAEASRPVVLYAVAPLTNVARALQKHPDLVADLEGIVIMGGALGAPGNVEGANAEWNFWIDVPAAAAVIASDAQITLVPLDATSYVPVPDDHQQALSEANQTGAVAYLSGLLDIFPSATSDFYFMWDELAASVASGEPVAGIEMIPVVVVVGGSDDGRTVPADEGHMITVAVGVEHPDAFHDNFVSVLSGGV